MNLVKILNRKVKSKKWVNHNLIKLKIHNKRRITHNLLKTDLKICFNLPKEQPQYNHHQMSHPNYLAVLRKDNQGVRQILTCSIS